MTYIFDFDGTIVDSFEYVLGFLAKEAGRKEISEEEAARYRNKSMKDIALGLGISLWRLPFLYFKGRRIMRAHMDNLRAFDGVLDVIRRLNDDGHQLFIISSNSARNIKRFLIKNGMTQYFHAVWGGAGLFGKDNLIKQLRRRYKISGEIWYVGDETTDIRAAKVARVRIAAVAWGFASVEELAAKEPDVLIRLPEELLHLTGVAHETA